MKIAILFLLFMVSCSKEIPQIEEVVDKVDLNVSSEMIDSKESNEKIVYTEPDPLDFDSQDKKELEKYKTKNGKQYVVDLGSFQVEYFADRLLIKADSAGIPNKITKFTYHKANKIYHKITLGTFDSKEEAEEAVSKMKKEAPELLFKIIEI